MTLPAKLQSARMTNATLGSQIDDNVGALEQAVCDILGMPIDTDIAAALFEIVAAGLRMVLLQDSAADPSAVGQIRRNGAALKFHDGTVVRELTQVWVPPGIIVPYGGSVAPTGYLLCDGAPHLRATYANLFAAIGTSFGAGNGTTTFNVPDGRGRVLVGLDAGQAEFNTLGLTGGAKSSAHTHGFDHFHSINPTATPNLFAGVQAGGVSFPHPNHQHSVPDTTSPVGTTNTGSQSVSQLPPYLTGNYIIKT